MTSRQFHRWKLVLTLQIGGSEWWRDLYTDFRLDFDIAICKCAMMNFARGNTLLTIQQSCTSHFKPTQHNPFSSFVWWYISYFWVPQPTPASTLTLTGAMAPSLHIWVKWINDCRPGGGSLIDSTPCRSVLACVAGGIRGHERMGSLKYRLPKNYGASSVSKMLFYFKIRFSFSYNAINFG
jgi:hypothetical protein